MCAAVEMEELAVALGAAPFDLMLVGDGSGSAHGSPCAWSVTAYERATGRTWEHFGGASAGSSNYAELAPFAHALWRYHVGCYGNGGETPAGVALRVLVVSDSEVTVRCGQGRYERRANAALWAMVGWFERNGYALTWAHVPRNSNPLSARADGVAGAVRRGLPGLGKAGG